MFSVLLGIYLGVESAGSYGNSVFNIPRNRQTVFHSGCTIVQPRQQCMRFPISLLPSQHLLLYVLFILSILVAMKWYLIVVLICISPVIMMLSIFSCAYWPFLYLHLMNLKVTGLEVPTTLEYFPKSYLQKNVKWCPGSSEHI